MVEIIEGIEIIEWALYITKGKVLIIGDLHLGFEDAIIKEGYLVPKFQFKAIKENLERIFENKEIKKIILNGDVKHEFSRINNQEWDNVYGLLEFLKDRCDVEIILGNHDVIMKKNLESKGYNVKSYFIFDDMIILHGDSIPFEAHDKNTIIIGHEHPSVMLKEGPKAEKYKCFIKGKWKDKTLIVMPSFNPLSEGSDILNDRFLSPFMEEPISNFELFIVGDEVYNFGKVKNLVSRYTSEGL